MGDAEDRRVGIFVDRGVTSRVRPWILIPLKNPMNASTSMNGKSPMVSSAPPFVLRLSKDERRVYQQNRILLCPGAGSDITIITIFRFPSFFVVGRSLGQI